ncbi:hypothetical protein ACS0TY_005362 [Phlomoides rotata]
MVDEDAKIIRVVGGLTLGTKLWKDMNRNWRKTYTEFQERAGVIMSIIEALAREVGGKKEDKMAQAESKKWTAKKTGGSHYKVPDDIKAFAENVEIKENEKPQPGVICHQ